MNFYDRKIELKVFNLDDMLLFNLNLIIIT